MRSLVERTTRSSCAIHARVAGGALSGPFTSNANLQEGAVNDLKNKAHKMGGNYVVLENTNAGTTISGDRGNISGQQTDVTHMGNAYRCPRRLVGL